MKLLVKRDKTKLVSTEGQAIVDENLPCILKVPRVIKQDEIRKIEPRDEEDDLLIVKNEDFRAIDEHLNNTNTSKLMSLLGLVSFPTEIPGIWSGYRSALAKDPKTGKLYRLKGVALDPKNPQIQKFEDGNFWVIGGQKIDNLENEISMSEFFNKTLLNNGIQPTMSYRGMWKFPRATTGSKKIRNQRTAASIYEVEGDTRLDELLFVLESLTALKLGGSHWTYEGELYFRSVNKLVETIGYTIGRLKKLMDLNYQTWSCDSERTNAHIGNVVLYNGCGDSLKLGFVDFDASENPKSLKKSDIQKLQEMEHQTLIKSMYEGPISLRQLNFSAVKTNEYGQLDVLIVQELRESMIRSFVRGYEQKPDNVSNELQTNLEFFKLIATILRNGRSLTHNPNVPQNFIYYDKSYEVDRYSKEKEKKSYSYCRNDLDDIIRMNIGYNDYLLGKGSKKMDRYKIYNYLND